MIVGETTWRNLTETFNCMDKSKQFLCLLCASFVSIITYTYEIDIKNGFSKIFMTQQFKRSVFFCCAPAKLFRNWKIINTNCNGMAKLLLRWKPFEPWNFQSIESGIPNISWTWFINVKIDFKIIAIWKKKKFFEEWKIV